MSSVGTINLTGKSGTVYQFAIYERAQKFTAVGGLYVMSKIVTGGNYSLIYIGQTGDLSSRPLSHHKTACFDKHGADKLLIRAEGDETKRLDTETDLVRNYNPPCNG
jgi:hypothetical protein